MTANTRTTSQEAVEDEDDDFVDAEEKGLLANPPNESSIPSSSPPADKTQLSNKFWISAAINSAATVAIVRNIRSSSNNYFALTLCRSFLINASSPPPPSATPK